MSSLRHMEYYLTVELYTSVRTDLSGTDVRGLFDAYRVKNSFISQAKSRLLEDMSASEIQRKEKEYFAYADAGAEDLARKISKRAATEVGFIANCSVWSSV